MKTHTTLLAAICLFFSLHSYAQPCLPAASAHLDINNVDALILNGSDKWVNPGLGIGSYVVPKGGSKVSMYDAALWIGGLDAAGNLHLAAETYRQTGNDFWTGPVEKNNCVVSTNNNNCPTYQHVWNFTKSDILNFISTGTATNDILTYPANGNTAAGELAVLAPFYDANANGIYETSLGDYPLMDVNNTLPDSNPVKDVLSIQYTLPSSKQTEVSLFNLYGQKIITVYNGMQPAGAHEIKADMKNVAAGIYLIDVTIAGERTVKKIVKE